MNTTTIYHDALKTGTQTLGTAYNVTDVLVFDMNAALAYQPSKANFHGFVEGIHIRLTTMAGGPTKLSMKLCLDADGDYTVVPSTEATIDPGITTPTTGCVAFSVRLPIFQILSAPGNGNLYLFAKLDAGTAVFSQACITWSE